MFFHFGISDDSISVCVIRFNKEVVYGLHRMVYGKQNVVKLMVDKNRTMRSLNT